MRKRRRQRYKLNAPGSSSKANIVESLLNLGDVARNQHVGEVQIALGKAKLFIDKFGLIQYDGRYQQLVEKLAAHLRGEKVQRDDQNTSARSSSSSSAGSSTSGRSGGAESFWERSKRQAQEDAARRWRDYVKQQEEAKKAGGTGYDPYGWRASRRRGSRSNERARQRYDGSNDTKSYHRPSRYDGIEWLWKLTTCPKRGKAGERWKAYYGAKTVQELLDKGGKWSDVKYNITHGYMKTFVQ